MLVNKVFVYGSLRSGMFNYDKLLKGKVKGLKLGKINGELFHIENKGYPAVVCGNKEIVGELMEFKDFNRTLSELDELEGYIYGDKNSEYIREEIEVSLEDGTKEKAYFYKYNKFSKRNERDNLILVNSGDWLNR
ncbi:gamma-glutamylcyclotransferase (GGCT)/AIG2-like uncharacterized protein YtfP [Clostridium moniliforme]|uniref:Gamma-glutamylcyclotransferase (GGCT)/AIG2-like uncharacterized protein YtfP n=1 Tax=Clostridium moniliforme TaxID=39489 RepID=A0ABS4F270_9CLOT|nr:gamma-glutamylcyclotransferase family protein [Clostridium moniliforme]MBP1890338.1 gamma-glutamylcyclotransferase (GGCT)/AIG2-like uncharacterized protein YtfP [Clostridium moniliforme]